MIPYEKALLFASNPKDEKLIDFQRYFVSTHKIALEIVSDYEHHMEWDKKTFYLLYLSDRQIKHFFKLHHDKAVDAALLPHEGCPQSMVRYGIAKDIYAALDDALNDALRVNEQLLLCNGEVVYHKISIGNVQNLNRSYFQNAFFSQIKSFFSALGTLRYQAMTLKTYKENSTNTVASGVLIFEDFTFFATLKQTDSSTFHDGKLNAFIIAPDSLLSYIYHLFLIFLYHRFSWGNLPSSIGFISTRTLSITGAKPFDFSIDETQLSAKEIEVEIISCALRIGFGKSFAPLIEAKPEVADNETVNIKYLPKGELRELLIKGKVPFFKKANDEDMKETLTSIKESSRISSIYLTLIILSTLLATVGIFQDSTPSVIGAMILAPLMAPIISLSMGMARSDKNIISHSIRTLSVGVASALLFSSLLTMFLPLNFVTTQMQTRINPNVLDLLVAIFSGIAGAYASAKEEVAKSLAGVAIAVALVPPLAVTGIGIGWLDIEMIYGSFLLFLTNLVGMILAASLTFIVLGFAPIHRAKKGLFYSLGTLAMVSIPLMLSFYTLILQSNDYAKLRDAKSIVIEGAKLSLNLLEIKESTKEQVVIEAEVVSETQLGLPAYQEIAKVLEAKVGKRVKLLVIPKIRVNP